MYKLNIHGVPFYGKYNKHHYKAIFNIAEVTKKEEWNGVTAVYCNDGYKKTNGGDYAGGYISFKAAENETPEELKMELFKQMFERDMVFDIHHNYKSPFIYICGDKLKRETDFVFNLLHELGHHINKKEYGDTITKAEDEILAHKYAISNSLRIFGYLKIKDYTYLQDALNEMNLKFSSFKDTV